MNELRFEATILREEGISADVVRERVYGDVRVTAEWPADPEAAELHVTVRVRGDVDWRDAPAYVELFFHDVFLLMNLATPGSFGGTISVAGGELRVRELELSPRVFAPARGLRRLPLETVATWYQREQPGTRQIATSGVTTALFRLLQLASGEEREEQSVLALAHAAEALMGRPDSLRRLFELRDEIAHGRMPVFHPMHDDALDPRVEDATREWIEVADDAAGVVIRDLQERIMAG